MTQIRLGSKLTRKTHTEVQRRALIVTLFPGYMELRQERTRTPFAISYDAIYRYAARLAADKQIADRKAAKKASSQHIDR